MTDSKRIIKYNGVEIEVHYYDAPLHHEDWHRAEDAGLVYVKYQHDVHVSKNTSFVERKIECEDCHTEIKHGRYGDLLSQTKE